MAKLSLRLINKLKTSIKKLTWKQLSLPIDISIKANHLRTKNLFKRSCFWSATITQFLTIKNYIFWWFHCSKIRTKKIDTIEFEAFLLGVWHYFIKSQRLQKEFSDGALTLGESYREIDPWNSCKWKIYRKTDSSEVLQEQPYWKTQNCQSRRTG